MDRSSPPSLPQKPTRLALLRRAAQAAHPDVFTRIRVATMVGVRPKQYGKWENGQQIPNARNQRKLAKIFNVTVADLFGDEP